MVQFLLGLLLFICAPMVLADCASLDCSALCGNQSVNKSTWLPRSFGSYTSNEINMIEPVYGHSDRDQWHGVLSVTPLYMQSFDRKNCANSLASLPFWSGTNSLTYGSNDGLSDADGYQFGLGNISNPGKVELNVNVKHFGADSLLYFVQNKVGSGMYFTLRFPLAQMRVTTCLTDTGFTRESTIDANNLDASDVLTPVSPDPVLNHIWLTYPAADAQYNSASTFFSGGRYDGESFESPLHRPLNLSNARIANCTQTITRLSEIGASIGYQFFANERHNLRAGFKCCAPTGNVANAKYALEPIVGRNGMWALGGELAGCFIAWENDEESRRLVINAQGEVFNLRCSSRPQFRTFDLLKNGKGSRYMIAQFYFPEEPDVLTTTNTTPNVTGRTPSYVTHVANLTTYPVTSKIKVEGSFSFCVELQDEKWLAGIGAEVWGRSKECLSINDCQIKEFDSANLNDFAIVGRQVSDDARETYDQTPAFNNPIIAKLYLCEPEATINTAETTLIGSYTAPAPAYTYPGGVTTPATPMTTPTGSGIKDARFAENRIPSKFSDALDLAGAAASRAISVKVFGKLGRQFNEYRYAPQINVVGGAEFSVDKGYETLNLWSIGLQGSLVF